MKDFTQQLGECCPVMALVLDRASGRVGIFVETMFSFSSGKPTREVIVAKFPRGKDRKAPHADATYAPFEWCPFCGAALTELAKESKQRKVKVIRSLASKPAGGSDG